MINVMVCGFFDMLHYGHIEYLRKAKMFGDRLIVSLGTDEQSVDKKGRHCFYTLEQRKMMLEAIKYVDIVIDENSEDERVDIIKKMNVHIYIDGEQCWDEKTKTGKYDYLKDYCEVFYLPRTPAISTTEILLRKNSF